MAMYGHWEDNGYGGRELVIETEEERTVRQEADNQSGEILAYFLIGAPIVFLLIIFGYAFIAWLNGGLIQ